MSVYLRTTAQNLVDRLTERVGNNSTFWVGQEKLDAVNEARREWQVLTGEEAKGFDRPVTGEIFYSVPKQVAGLSRVLWNGTPLTSISLWELDNAYPGWQGTTGTPLYWAPVGVNLMAISPQPTTGTLRFEGYAEIPRLTLGEYLQIGDEELTRLLGYGQYYLTYKEGGAELKATMGLMKALLAAGTLRNRRLNASAFFNTMIGRAREENERLPRTADGSSGIRG